MIYKISVVIPGAKGVGGILNVEKLPERGELLKIGREEFEVVEVIELMPPRGEFGYLHVTCKPLDKKH